VRASATSVGVANNWALMDRKALECAARPWPVLVTGRTDTFQVKAKISKEPI